MLFVVCRIKRKLNERGQDILQKGTKAGCQDTEGIISDGPLQKWLGGFSHPSTMVSRINRVSAVGRKILVMMIMMIMMVLVVDYSFILFFVGLLFRFLKFDYCTMRIFCRLSINRFYGVRVVIVKRTSAFEYYCIHTLGT